jgi:branched-chain amino acid transport system substrate-binding protein
VTSGQLGRRRGWSRRRWWSVLVALAALTAAGAARAETTVTIGAIYPLAQRADARSAIETAAEIINTPQPGLEGLPLGAGKGLPNLGGAKLAITFADDLGNPSVAQAQALRLVTRDHASALIGAGAAAEVLAATTLAEHHAIPFVVPDVTAPSITGRGYGWVFRTTPLAEDIARAYVRFLEQLKTAGQKIGKVATLVDASEQGREVETKLRGAAQTDGLPVAGFRFPADTNDLSPLVQKLRTENPDALIVHADAAAARLLVTTMNTLGYKPPIMIGDGAGFAGSDFIATSGNLAQGLISRSVWSAGPPGSPTAIINDLYKGKGGRDLDDESARILQGVFVLADAINRAGSTDPGAIRDALRRTDLKSDQLIVGYDAVKFDSMGQNTLAATYLTQFQGKQYVTVWPPERAAGKLALPFRGAE